MRYRQRAHGPWESTKRSTNLQLHVSDNLTSNAGLQQARPPRLRSAASSTHTHHAAGALSIRRSSAEPGADKCSGQGTDGRGGATSRLTGAGAAARGSDAGKGAATAIAAAPTRHMRVALRDAPVNGATLSVGRRPGEETMAGPTRHAPDPCDTAAAPLFVVGAAAGRGATACAAAYAGLAAAGPALEAETVADPTRHMRAASSLGAAAAAGAAGTDLTPAGDRSDTANATGPTRHIRVAVPPVRLSSFAAGVGDDSNRAV